MSAVELTPVIVGLNWQPDGEDETTLNVAGWDCGVPGLAITPTPRTLNGRITEVTHYYRVTHIASGKAISDGFDTVNAAARYARILAPLADWTLDTETLRAQKELAEKTLRLRETVRTEDLPRSAVIAAGFCSGPPEYTGPWPPALLGYEGSEEGEEEE